MLHIGGIGSRGHHRSSGGGGSQRWHDKQVDLVAALGGGDEQCGAHAGEPTHPTHTIRDGQAPDPAFPRGTVEDYLPNPTVGFGQRLHERRQLHRGGPRSRPPRAVENRSADPLVTEGETQRRARRTRGCGCHDLPAPV
jgi:hypothetical protein